MRTLKLPVASTLRRRFRRIHLWRTVILLTVVEEEAVNVSFKQDHYIDENCKASCSKYIQEEIEEDSSVESSQRKKLRKKTKISRKDLRMLGPSREPRASIPSNQLMTQI